MTRHDAMATPPSSTRTNRGAFGSVSPEHTAASARERWAEDRAGLVSPRSWGYWPDTLPLLAELPALPRLPSRFMLDQGSGRRAVQLLPTHEGDGLMSAAGRSHVRGKYVCEACRMRRAIGEPKGNDLWPQRLNLAQEQIDQLTVAAVEFEELSEAAGTISNAVDFVDWVSVDALRRGAASPVIAELPVLRTKDYRRRGAA